MVVLVSVNIYLELMKASIFQRPDSNKRSVAYNQGVEGRRLVVG